MKLNTLKPAAGSKHSRHRVGRGVGSGWGKTAGLGHKGQRARSGGFHKVGFEGGQMPLHRRLPKRGFKSPAQKRNNIAEVRTGELELMKATDIDLSALKAEHVVPQSAQAAKVILCGKLERKLTLKQSVKASKGARSAIESAGGAVELAPQVEEKPKKEKKQKKAEPGKPAEAEGKAAKE